MYEGVATRKETLHSGDGRFSSENKNVGSWLQNFSSKINEKNGFPGNAFVGSKFFQGCLLRIIGYVFYQSLETNGLYLCLSGV